jgi:hypothetical protein
LNGLDLRSRHDGTDPGTYDATDCNLRAFEYIPLLIARLRRSRAWLTCKRRPELAFYMINLWTAAWHEVPAGSLEDDDDVLADLAMCDPANGPGQAARAPRLGAVQRRAPLPPGRRRPRDQIVELKPRTLLEEGVRPPQKTNKDREKDGLPPLPMPPKPEKATPPPAPANPAEVGRKSDGRKPEVQATSAGIPAENALKGREREGKGDVRDMNLPFLTERASRPPLSPKDRLWRDGRCDRRHGWPATLAISDRDRPLAENQALARATCSRRSPRRRGRRPSDRPGAVHHRLPQPWRKQAAADAGGFVPPVDLAMSTFDLLSRLGISFEPRPGNRKTVCPKCSHTRKNKRDPCLSVKIEPRIVRGVPQLRLEGSRI